MLLQPFITVTAYKTYFATCNRLLLCSDESQDTRRQHVPGGSQTVRLEADNERKIGMYYEYLKRREKPVQFKDRSPNTQAKHLNGTSVRCMHARKGQFSEDADVHILD